MSSFRPTLFVWATLGVAVLFGAVVLLPHLLQRLDPTYPFQGIELLGIDSEPHYASRTREVADGFLRLGNVFYASSKDQPYLQPPLPEIVLAALDRFLPTDLPQSFVLSKGIFAFLLTLSMVGCFVCITGRRWESLLASSILLFATFALTSPWTIYSHLFEMSSGHDFLRFARPVNPLWTDVWFFLAIFLIASWLRERARWKIVLVALFVTILLYSYVWAWTYLGVALALLLVFFLWQRSWQCSLDLALFAGIFFLLGIPFLLNSLEATLHPAYADTVARLGLAPSHTPIIGVWLILFLLFSFTFARTLWPAVWPLLPALSLGGLIALNQQLVTGTVLQPHHYHWYFIQPLASVLILVASLEWLGRNMRWIKTPLFFIPFFFIAVSSGVLYQWRSFESHREEWGKVQTLRPLMDVIQEHAGPGDIIFAPPSSPVSELVPLYTGANVYTSGNANNYLTSEEKARDILFFQLWIEGLIPDEAAQRFPADLRFRLSSRLYSMYYRELLGDFAAIPDEVVSEHVQSYREYFALPREEKLLRYPIDFLALTPEDILTEELAKLKDEGKVLFDYSGFLLIDLRKG